MIVVVAVFFPNVATELQFLASKSGQETTDAELWFQLFLRSCWPPSGALLAFAEGTTTPVGIDWRERMQVRMESTPTIVVDMGRGYTKFTVVHGVRGRCLEWNDVDIQWMT